MPPLDSAIRAEGISSFLQNAQMQAYADKISSFAETVKSLQADKDRLQDHHSQEIGSLKAIVKSLQASSNKSEVENAALQEHQKQEVSCLQTLVRSLRDSNKKAEADIAKLQDQHNRDFGSLNVIIKSLQASVQSLQASVKKAEADNTRLQDLHNQELGSMQTIPESLKVFAEGKQAKIKQLQDEIAGLREQFGRTEDSSLDGEAHHDHGPRQSGKQLQDPSGRQPFHNHFVRSKREHQLSPQHETQANLQLPLYNHGDDHAPGPSRPHEQQHPRGIKRAHVEDAAEPSLPTSTAEEADGSHRFEKPRSKKTHQTKRSDHKRVHDEVPSREEDRESHMQARGKSRRDGFVAYYKSMREEHKNANLGRDQGAFIRRFIDGIPDPDYCRWYQEALKTTLPERVHYASRPTGRRFVTVSRDLTWEDAKAVVRNIRIPDLAG